MIAVWVIGAYLALAAWVWAMEGVQALGKATGAWDISQTRVLGLLLPERTLERVAPPNVAGFNARQELARRTDQADWMLTFVGSTLREADRVPGADPGGVAGVLAQMRLSERRVADEPVEQIRAWHAEGTRLFEEVDAIKGARNDLGKLRLALDRAERFSEESPAAERFDAWRDDVAAAIEEVSFAIEDAQKSLGEGSDLAKFDVTPMVDAADALLASNAPEDVAGVKGKVPTAALAEVRRFLDAAGGGFDAEIEAKVTQIEGVILKLMPIPGGVDGLLYRAKLSLGTDRQGRSILIRGLYSAKIAVQVGTVVALVSVFIGAMLGSAAAYFGGWVDHAVTWLYSSLSSLPQLVLLAVLSFMFLGSQFEKTLLPVYAAFCLTFWIGPCRVIRGEVMKIKELEYAQAATAIGFSRGYILRKHVVPNTMHLMFINFSLLFIGAIKSEVILTFLGLGIKEGASWGIMISQSQPEVITGFFWQIGTATAFMLVLVLAFNVLSDALQDAFDPKAV